MWKYFKVVVKVIFPILWAYMTWIFKYSNHPEKYDFRLRFAKVQKLVRRILKAFNVSVKDIGLENFNSINESDPNRFIICNHLSDSDALILIAYSKRPISFVSKIESAKYPLVGRIIRALSGEFIDREDLKMQLKVFRNIERRMKEEQGLDWVIFPEGTRNKIDIKNVLDFHYGTFKPAMRNNLDIYVLSMMGSQRILDKKCKDKTYIVQLKLNKVITHLDYANKTTVEVSDEARSACQEGVISLLDSDRELSLKFNKKN